MFRRSTSKLLKTLFSALHAAAIVSVAGHSFGLPRSGESVGKPILFENKVQSIFAKRCASCHNSTPSAGFSVASLGLVLEGGRSGRAVVPGSTAESLLFKLISTGKMPPAPAKLTPLEIKTIGDWIMSGAKGNGSRAGHWAFQPLRDPALPAVHSQEACPICAATRARARRRARRRPRPLRRRRRHRPRARRPDRARLRLQALTLLRTTTPGS